MPTIEIVFNVINVMVMRPAN